MKKTPARFATTYTDLHDESLTLEALHSITERINSTFLPIGVEHDPRQPPVGRIAYGVVEELSDGAHAVTGEIEMFEDADLAGKAGGARRAHVHLYFGDELVLSEDRAFSNDEDLALLRELTTSLSAARKREVKKAAEAMAVLTFAFTALAGGILGGIGKKLGEAVWEQALPTLRTLLAKKRGSGINILKFSITCEIASSFRLIELVLDNPSDDDINSCREVVLQQALSAATAEIEASPFRVRFVFRYSAKKKLALLYSVAENGIPLHGRLPERIIEPGQGLSFGAQIDDA
jgi:hypothetical protein